MRGAIDMRLKLDSLFGQLAKRRQAEDLKSTAIGQYRVLPGHEVMEPAQSIYRRVSGPQVKMICVAKDDSSPGVFKHLLSERFNGALRTDGHESGSVDRAVSGADAARARLSGVVARNFLE